MQLLLNVGWHVIYQRLRDFCFCRSDVNDMLNDAIIGAPFSILQGSLWYHVHRLSTISHMAINCFDTATLSFPRDWKRFTYETLWIWSYCKSWYSKHTNGPPHNHTTVSQLVSTSTLHSPGKTPTKYRTVSSCQAGHRIMDIRSEMGTHITNSCNQTQEWG